VETTIDSRAVGEVLRRAAREHIMPRFNATRADRKCDGSVVTAADVESQRSICEALQALHPGIPILGEEMSRTEQEAAMASNESTPLWCLDPLDGTSNFAAGVPVFGISLAYVVKRRPQQAWVYDPVREELFTAARQMGAYLNGVRLEFRPAPSLERAVGVVDFKRLPRAMAQRVVSEMPFHSQRNFGSSAIEWCWLAAGRFHFYLHGGQQFWDLAAGCLILEETGGVARNFAGDPLGQLGQLAPQSVLAALDPRLEAEWRAWLAAGSSKT
jgi:myo-inositol-1(or 4)-monophosphatase